MYAYTGLCYFTHSGGVPGIGLWFPPKVAEKLPVDFFEEIQYEEGGELDISVEANGLMILYSADFSALSVVDRFNHALALAVSIHHKLERIPFFTGGSD